MKKIVYVFLLVFLSFVIINVKAATCTDEERAKQVEIAKNIKITYQHLGGVDFDLVITNLSKNMHLIDDVKSNFIYGTGETLTLHHYYAGVYTFRVFPDTGVCKNQRVYDLMIQIPRYNSYADTNYCKDNPDFKYCDPWYKGYISLDAFSKGITEYEKEKEEKNKEELDKSFKTGLKDFYEDNKMYILGGGIALTLVIAGIAIYIMRDRRDIKI